MKSARFFLLVYLVILSPAAPGQTPTPNVDLSGDGKVDEEDLFLFQRAWYGTSATEESPKAFMARYYVAPFVDVSPSVPPNTFPIDLSQVTNFDTVDTALDLGTAKDVLRDRGFVVIPNPFEVKEDMVQPYHDLHSSGIARFVTSDSLLHLYHVQFDETLKEVEEGEFYDDLEALTTALAAYFASVDASPIGGEDPGQVRRMCLAFFSVALKLLRPDLPVSDEVASLVDEEIALIEAHSGFVPSPIFTYKEDYSQYVPRGHYTRSDALERYFKAMMWYGRMGFLMKGCGSLECLISREEAKRQTIAAAWIVSVLPIEDVDGRTAQEIWDRIYGVTAFYVGLADDLIPAEYRNALADVLSPSEDLGDLQNDDTFLRYRVTLASLRNPRIYGGTGNCVIAPPFDEAGLYECLEKTKGLRFMGQRFIPDSYMMQQLVFPAVGVFQGTGYPFSLVPNTAAGPIRGFPRGLDVMAVLGSQQADELLVAAGDTDYDRYAEKREELASLFSSFSISEWNRNLYWGWLYVLRSLLGEFGEGYPSFMRTTAWLDKELNAALGSWTELRHDTILYAKQSYTPVPTGVPPELLGYVEPIPEFWARLKALTTMTRAGLDDLGLLNEESRDRLVKLEGTLDRLLDLATKLLEHTPLTEEDYRYIDAIGFELAGTVEGVTEEGFKTTLVADVHTDANTEQVVEEGVGYTRLLVAVYALPSGELTVGVGPVFSYSEFKWPMSDRLTDEAWRALLEASTAPEPMFFAPH